MAPIPSALSAANAIALVAAKAEDPNQTQFSGAQYNAALDLAQQQFAVDARSLVQETTVALVAGQSEYSLPSDFLGAVLFRANGLKLTPMTKLELSFQNDNDWTQYPAGVPVAVYMDEQNAKFGLVPAPDATNAAYTFLLTYFAAPATIAGGAANLLNGLTIMGYYAPAVVAWAARELLSYIPQTQEVITKRSELMKEYERYKDQAITTYNNMVDEPIRMLGGQIWQDNILKPVDNAFTDF